MVKYFWYEHPVSLSRDELFGCQEYETNAKWNGMHSSCIPRPVTKKIDHPCHPNHPLELLLQGPPNYSAGNQARL
ncbi:hypothetical protein ARALYDRAFT_903704 [Arabidopsis lyrata subsp. lyrata]|uniref:Uncharacterized protein n=1 Tax=Arabidopsis lyrata subsp. lyrata TaxID=81972 RepID=D7LJZ0_ARALL|nr:hypothetical protein ARALYDRAFT_903704 [Arabidopsis lyrata subsp. lyrata]